MKPAPRPVKTKQKAVKPPLSHMAVAFRHIKPNWRNYINYLRRSDDEDIIELLDVFDALPKKDQCTIMPEQLCDLAKIKPSQLFGAVSGALYEFGENEARLITAVNFAPVVERVAKVAKGNGQFASKEREMFLKSTGYLPTPKNPGINVDMRHQTLVADGRQLGGLPSIEREVLDAEETLVRQLPSPSSD